MKRILTGLAIAFLSLGTTVINSNLITQVNSNNLKVNNLTTSASDLLTYLENKMADYKLNFGSTGGPDWQDTTTSDYFSQEIQDLATSYLQGTGVSNFSILPSDVINLTAPQKPNLFKLGDKVQVTYTYYNKPQTFTFSIWKYDNTPWIIIGVSIPAAIIVIAGVTLVITKRIKSSKKIKD